VRKGFCNGNKRLVILYDYYHPELVSKITKAPLQLDVYIPMYNFAIEYQGSQHYNEDHYWNVGDRNVLARDQVLGIVWEVDVDVFVGKEENV
jgi:hypothetical protein